METWSFTRRVEASAFFVLALALGAVANGCGREPSMASKSARAYQETVEQGLPVGSGHGGHGGSENADHSGMTMPAATAEHEHGTGAGADDQPMAAMDHSRHAGGTPMAGMDHSQTAKPGRAAPMAGLDHSQPADGNPVPMTGMDHSTPVAETATPMAGMDHGAMGHGSRAASQEPVPAPSSSSELGQLDPARTLAPDEFDQVVAPLPTGATEQGVKKEQP